MNRWTLFAYRRLSVYSRWPLGDFCGQCEDVRLDDGSDLWSEPIFITRFSITRGPKKLLHMVSFEAGPIPNTICSTRPWTVEGFSFLWTRNVIMFLVSCSTRLCHAIRGPFPWSFLYGTDDWFHFLHTRLRPSCLKSSLLRLLNFVSCRLQRPACRHYSEIS
jgi:hypothetical protein